MPTDFATLADHVTTVTVPRLAPKAFRSGSKGFYAQSRVSLNGDATYLVTLQAVPIDPASGRAVKADLRDRAEDYDGNPLPGSAKKYRYVLGERFEDSGKAKSETFSANRKES